MSRLACAANGSVALRRPRRRLRSDRRASVVAIRWRDGLPAGDLDSELERRRGGYRSEVAAPAFARRAGDIDAAVAHQPEEVGALEPEQARGVRAVAAGCGQRPFDDLGLEGREEGVIDAVSGHGGAPRAAE